QEDDVGEPVPRQGQSVLSVRRGADGVVPQLQQVGQELNVLRLIVHHEHHGARLAHAALSPSARFTTDIISDRVNGFSIVRTEACRSPRFPRRSSRLVCPPPDMAMIRMPGVWAINSRIV